jgi:hypothetical protein
MSVACCVQGVCLSEACVRSTHSLAAAATPTTTLHCNLSNDGAGEGATKPQDPLLLLLLSLAVQPAHIPPNASLDVASKSGQHSPGVAQVKEGKLCRTCNGRGNSSTAPILARGHDLGTASE